MPAGRTNSFILYAGSFILGILVAMSLIVGITTYNASRESQQVRKFNTTTVKGEKLIVVEVRPGEDFPSIHLEPDASGVKPKVVYLEIDPHDDPRKTAAKRYMLGLITKQELDRMGVVLDEPHELNQEEKQELLKHIQEK